jgi:hypothetical protein
MTEDDGIKSQTFAESCKPLGHVSYTLNQCCGTGFIESGFVSSVSCESGSLAFHENPDPDPDPGF